MSRYINADKLVVWCAETLQVQSTTVGKAYVNALLTAVDSCPTADVVEVRHGYWKQNPFFKSIYYCSECGRHIEDGSNDKNPSKNFPYCHCGAKMDGERSENGT